MAKKFLKISLVSILGILIAVFIVFFQNPKPAESQYLPACSGDYTADIKCGGIGNGCSGLIPPENAKVGAPCLGYTDPYLNNECPTNPYATGTYAYQCVVQQSWGGNKYCASTYWSWLTLSNKPIKPCEVAAGEEGCYIKLTIKETKIRDILDEEGNIIDQEVQFSLESVENLYGLYAGLVNEYDSEIPGNYTLNVYNTAGNLVKKYSLSSSRFILWDCFAEDCPEPGGIIENDEGLISTIIPYRNDISAIKVQKGGTETNLEVSPSQFHCQRTCKIENETGNYETESCCLEFMPVTLEDSSFICTNCGDGICSEYETEYSCWKDCYVCDVNATIQDWLDDKIYMEEALTQIKKCWAL